MSGELYEQVYNNLNLKDTAELLEIWITNDHEEWSDITFEIIEQILKTRGMEIPKQNKSTDKHEDDDFSEEELKIIDDENPPDFYDPFEVLKVSNWLEKIAMVSIYIGIISSALQFPKAQQLAQSYFQGTPLSNIFAPIIAVASTGSAGLMVIVTTYFPLKALAYILRVLMEMEFNSRKIK